MVDVNYIAVLVAAVASMAAGFVWYSPVLFAKPWMRLMGYTAESMKNDQKKMMKFYGLSFVLALITAYVLSHVIVMSEHFFGMPRLQTGLTSAFWMWLGFVMPVQATDTIFSKDKKWQLFGINTGYQLVALLLMGAALGIID